jgi:glycerate kinase
MPEAGLNSFGCILQFLQLQLKTPPPGVPMIKIVCAPNPFKGSLSANRAAGAMARGAARAAPDAEIVTIPFSDGGDGLVEVVAEILDGAKVAHEVSGPLFRPVRAEYCLLRSSSTAAIEMARASGLSLLDPEELDPLQTTTLGTGELIAHALDQGVTRILVGIGGSATNDGGVGMAAALGARFLDENQAPISPRGGALSSLARIDLSGMDHRLDDVQIDAVCDVDNPLLGPAGASRVYGPQKGADPDQVELLEEGMENLARLISRDLGLEVRDRPGAGAAGGLGAGLLAFLGAELRSGIDLMLEMTDLEARLERAGLVLTAEGRVDGQTFFGKGPLGVARAARSRGVPCVLLAGSVDPDLPDIGSTGVSAILPITMGPMSLDLAMARTEEALTFATEQAVRLFLATRISQGT